MHSDRLSDAEIELLREDSKNAVATLRLLHRLGTAEARRASNQEIRDLQSQLRFRQRRKHWIDSSYAVAKSLLGTVTDSRFEKR